MPAKPIWVVIALIFLSAFAVFNPSTKNAADSIWSHYSGKSDRSKFFNKGMVHALTNKLSSVYKIEKNKFSHQVGSASHIKKAATVCSTACKSCYGDNIAGRGIAPFTVNSDQRIPFDDFKTLITVGRGNVLPVLYG